MVFYMIDGPNESRYVWKKWFLLPMDGNTPIGKDQSGRGNDWTPVNFGGSTDIDQSNWCKTYSEYW